MTQQDIAWLDHHLRGGPAPGGPAGPGLPAGRGPVAGARRVAAAPAAAESAWYLRAGGGLSRPTPRGGDGGPDRFVYDPADPTPSVGRPAAAPARQAGRQPRPSRRGPTCWSTPARRCRPPRRGRPGQRQDLRADPSRARRRVRAAVRRRSRRRRRATSSTASGGSPATVPAADVEAGGGRGPGRRGGAGPDRVPAKAGHRIRLQVSGGAFPRYARNFGTGEPFGTATRAVALAGSTSTTTPLIARAWSLPVLPCGTPDNSKKRARPPFGSAASPAGRPAGAGRSRTRWPPGRPPARPAAARRSGPPARPDPLEDLRAAGQHVRAAGRADQELGPPVGRVLPAGQVAELLQAGRGLGRGLLAHPQPPAQLADRGPVRAERLQGEAVDRPRARVALDGQLGVQVVDERPERAREQERQLEAVSVPGHGGHGGRPDRRTTTRCTI